MAQRADNCQEPACYGWCGAHPFPLPELSDQPSQVRELNKRRPRSPCRQLKSLNALFRFIEFPRRSLLCPAPEPRIPLPTSDASPLRLVIVAFSVGVAGNCPAPRVLGRAFSQRSSARSLAQQVGLRCVSEDLLVVLTCLARTSGSLESHNQSTSQVCGLLTAAENQHSPRHCPWNAAVPSEIRGDSSEYSASSDFPVAALNSTESSSHAVPFHHTELA